MVRVIFFGSAKLSVGYLKLLKEMAEIETAAVVTQPDKPAGRGQESKKTAAAEEAAKENLLILKPVELQDLNFQKRLKSLKPDLGIMAAYQKLIPLSVINIFGYGILNVHYSLLPQYPGPAPIEWAILRGENETGVSIIKINAEYDQGEVVAQVKVGIGPEETKASLTKKCDQAGLRLLKKLGFKSSQSLALKTKAPRSLFYARKLTREDGFTAWNDLKLAMEGSRTQAERIDRMVRALSPWPGVWSLRPIHQDGASQGKGGKERFQRLKILQTHLEGGKLVVDKVQIEGKKPTAGLKAKL